MANLDQIKSLEPLEVVECVFEAVLHGEHCISVASDHVASGLRHQYMS